jgi:hypothetical protein
LNQYSVKDYHNQQGQFRNYQRDLESLSSYRQQQDQTGGAASAAATSTYDPMAQLQDNATVALAERDEHAVWHKRCTIVLTRNKSET